MPASLATLEFHHGMPSIHCPATGRLVASNEEGLDTDVSHSPHLRWVLDGLGNGFAVNPEVLPPHQAEYQRKVVSLLTREGAQFKSQNDLVAACVAAMPSSASESCSGRTP